MYLENDKYQHKHIEIIALFVKPGMQRRGTSRHVCIYIVSSLVIIFERILSFILSFSITCPQISPKNISNTLIMIETILNSNMYLMMWV